MLSFHPLLFSPFLLVLVRVPVRVCSVYTHSTGSQRFRDLVLGSPIPPSSHLTFRPLLIQLLSLSSLSSSLHNRLCPGLLTLPSRGATICLLPLLLFMSSVNNQEHQDLVTQELKLHCQILQIDNQATNFRCDKYRKLLLPQHPGEPLRQPKLVAPVGPVVLTNAAITPQQ